MITKLIVNTPNEIVHTQLGMPSDYREQLIKESYKLKNNRDEGNHATFKNVFNEDKSSKVVASSYALWNESRLYDLLLKNILDFINSLYLEPEFNIEITNTWLGIYDVNQTAKRHNHKPHFKSFCYYISAEEPYTPMIFDDTNVIVNAITDRLIVFPSNVFHSVPECRGGERIMIAGNTLIKGE